MFNIGLTFIAANFLEKRTSQCQIYFGKDLKTGSSCLNSIKSLSG